MSITTIRRRVGRLEETDAFPLVRHYPPLAYPELDAMARRVEAGERLTIEEAERLAWLSPIVEGELVVTANRGQIVIKRYIGIDAGEI